MPRNLDRRVEAVAPVDDPELQARLQEILDVNLADDTLAWELGSDGTWHQGRSRRSQGRQPPAAAGARPRALPPASRGLARRVKQSTEREVKLEAPPGFRLPRLENAVDGLTVVPLPRRSLTATYYDTPDLRLARWGLTVRYRTGDGTGWTVKLPEGDSGPALVRRELHFDGGPAELPDELLDLLRAYVRRDAMSQVARLRTTRTGVQLHSPEGEPQVEVVDDRVVVYDGRNVVGRFRQLEVEAESERGSFHNDDGGRSPGRCGGQA